MKILDLNELERGRPALIKSIQHVQALIRSTLKYSVHRRLLYHYSIPRYIYVPEDQALTKKAASKFRNVTNLRERDRLVFYTDMLSWENDRLIKQTVSQKKAMSHYVKPPPYLTIPYLSLMKYESRV